MKKFISLFLALILALSCSGLTALALPESASAFGISSINHYLVPSRHLPLQINITTPEAKPDATLIAVFYTDNQITAIKTVDASQSTKLSTIEFETSNYTGDGLPATPDKIRLFTWDTGTLKPLTNASENMLTPDVISEANRLVVINILDYLLGNSKKTNIINLLEGEFDDVRHDKVIKLLDAMRTCAEDAYSKKDSQLLTSEYARRMYRDEINDVISDIKSDSVQLEELKTVYANRSTRFGVTKGKYVGDTISRLLNLLLIDKDEFLGK